MADVKYKLAPTPQKVDSTYLYELVKHLAKYPNDNYLINFKNTQSFSLLDIRKIENVGKGRVFIRVEGGYDQHRIDSYPANIYHNMHKYDNVYTTGEIKRILGEIEKIENGINPNWSAEQKLMYFVGTLKNKIIYHPFHENAPSKDIRSLRGLFSHNTVCAGYAVILKELCDRNGIECQYVEGTCKKEDHDRGVLTHAWNIVKINGNYFPLDLTWNADSSAQGKTLDISDLANVNQFVKSHIPGRHEEIQDYTRLKSIDGSYLKSMNNVVNKDMTYELSTIEFKRNGYKISVSQVEQFVVDNEAVYKYVCFKEDNQGNKKMPFIFYSTTNVLEIMRICQKKDKLERQLADAKRRGQTEEATKLEELIKKYKSFPNANTLVNKLLFSEANLKAASERGDYFLGKVSASNNSTGERVPETVYVDPVFAKKINKKQRRMSRSDGTKFVLEDMGILDIGSGKSVFRYKMFESVVIDGQQVMKKNTIFTDQNLFHDNRQELADDFLSRSRIDRKANETSGYLGYYSASNVRTYDPNTNKYFRQGLYQRFRMRSDCVKDFVPSLNFDDMKRIIQIYGKEQVNGKWMVVNRETKAPVNDPVLRSHVEFASVWLYAAGVKWVGGEPVPGFYYAYEVEDAKNIFNYISSLINASIIKSGNIDPVEILRLVSDNHGLYKYAEQIVMRMFETPYNIKVLNEFYRSQNHSSIKEDTAIQPLFRDGLAWQQLDERRRQLEEEKKQLLEVIERNGQIEVVSARKK